MALFWQNKTLTETKHIKHGAFTKSILQIAPLVKSLHVPNQTLVNNKMQNIFFNFFVVPFVSSLVINVTEKQD